MKFDDLHPRLNGFDDVYQSGLKQKLEEADKKRHSVFRNFIHEFKIKVGVSTVLFLLFVIAGWITAALIVILAAAFFLIHEYIINTGSAHNLNPIVLGALCPCFELEYSARVGEKTFEEMMNLKLLTQYTRRNMRDRITGNINGVNIEAFKLKLEDTYKDNDGKEQVREVFNGVCIKTDYHKNLRGRTYVYVRFDFNRFSFSKIPGVGEPVDLEYPDFERFYDAYATDQVEARYILTPNFIERIWSFHNLIKGEGFVMAFDKNGLYIMLNGLNPYLTGGGHEFTDPKFLEAYIKNIALLYGVVDKLELDLKTKI